MKLFLRNSAYFLLLTLFSLSGITKGWTQTPLPVSDEVKVGTLKNGLTYYIQPNQRPKDIVELRLVLKAGSVLEDEDQQGLAHFAEHMCFNGTESFPRNELINHLQSMGVQFGADLNAYTSFEETVYILPIPTSDPKNIDIGFQILQEWASKVSFNEQDINEERGIVLEESRTGRGAMDRMMKQFLPLMLNHSHFSKRLPIGQDEIIQNFKPEVLKRFYQDWYRPNLMSVVVVGDMSVEEAEAMIHKYFDGLENPKNERPRKDFPIEPYQGQHTLVVTDSESPMYSFMLMFSAKPKEEIKTKEDYRNRLVRNLMFNMLNYRYSDQVAAGGASFSNAYVGMEGWARNYENFSLSVAPVDNIEEALNEGIAGLLRVDQYGFNMAELERAKKRYMNSAEQSVVSKADRRSTSLVSSYTQQFLSGGPLLSPDNTLDLYTEMLPTITLEEVNKYAQFIIESNKDYFGLVLGNGVDIKVPTNKELKTFINNAFLQKVNDIDELEVSDHLIATELKGGSIVKTTNHKDLGYTTYELNNGIKVHVKPTDLRTNEIIMSAEKKGGKSKYGVEDNYNLSLGFPTMLGLDLESAGFGMMGPNELTNYLTGKNASVNVNLGATSASVSGWSNIKDFETLMELTYAKMAEIRNDKDLFESNIRNTKAQLGFMSSMPQIGFVDTLQAVLYQEDPRAEIVIPKASDFDKIDLDRVLEIYNNEFAFADGFEFTFVGNIEEETMLPMITHYLGSLPVSHQASEIKDNGLRPITGNHKVVYRKGSEPQSLIIIQLMKDMDYDMDKALQMDMLADVITNKIIEKIREDHALIYGGGIYAQVMEFPYSNYSFTAQMPCGPENVEKVLDLLEEEIKALMLEGPTQEDLLKVKKAKLETHRKGLEENGRWANYILSASLWGKDAQQMLDFPNRVEKVNAQQLQDLLKLMWEESDKVVAIMMPEAE